VADEHSLQLAPDKPAGAWVERTRDGLSPPGIPLAALPEIKQCRGMEGPQISGTVSSQENISGLIRLVVGSNDMFKQIKMTQALSHFGKGSILFQPFQLMW